MLTKLNNSEILAQIDSGYRWYSDIITYTFATSVESIYGQQGEGGGFTSFNSSQQGAAQLALALWDDLIAPDLQRVDPQASFLAADIEFAMSTTGVEYAHAYYPEVGSVWLNSTYSSGTNSLTDPAIGRHGFAIYIHEIGHALGLAHMGDYDGAGAWEPGSYQDSTVYSIMSYFGPSWGSASGGGRGAIAWADWVAADGVRHSPQTPMLNDIMAIQAIYGAETTTRAGDTVYGFNTTITDASAAIYDFTRNRQPILTLFDSGGIDTLDLSRWRTGSIIDLAPGSFSSCNAMTNNIAIAYGCLIENAAGGYGADVIYGNALDNVLLGGAGNDLIFGLDGDDKILGGTGDDVLVGMAGDDVLSGNIGDDLLYGGEGQDLLLGGRGDDVIDGGEGSDVVWGHGGADRFVFGTALDSANVDRIMDFDAAEDAIHLAKAVFEALPDLGILDAALFAPGSSATDGDDRILYDSATGSLSYDPDGTGAAGAIRFASLDANLALTAANFTVI